MIILARDWLHRNLRSFWRTFLLMLGWLIILSPYTDMFLFRKMELISSFFLWVAVESVPGNWGGGSLRWCIGIRGFRSNKKSLSFFLLIWCLLFREMFHGCVGAGVLPVAFMDHRLLVYSLAFSLIEFDIQHCQHSYEHILTAEFLWLM